MSLQHDLAAFDEVKFVRWLPFPEQGLARLEPIGLGSLGQQREMFRLHSMEDWMFGDGFFERFHRCLYGPTRLHSLSAYTVMADRNFPFTPVGNVWSFLACGSRVRRKNQLD